MVCIGAGFGLRGIFSTEERQGQIVSPAVTTGSLKVTSNREGVQVSVDGVARGSTPLELTMPLGPHTLILENGGQKRTLQVTVKPGVELSENIEFPESVRSASPKQAGQLDVSSTPPGAPVRIDGQVRGKTPLRITDVAAGSHTVIVGEGDASVKKTVSVAGGAVSSVAVSSTEAQNSGGWLALRAPVELQVYEDGRLLGTTAVDRLMLPSGTHQLEVVSDQLAFRTALSIEISPGKISSRDIALPNGSLSVNALPWAEVAIDGRPMGTTPLANLSLPIGPHDVVWTNPERGERRQSVLVTANSATRVGVDFNK